MCRLTVMSEKVNNPGRNRFPTGEKRERRRGSGKAELICQSGKTLNLINSDFT